MAHLQRKSGMSGKLAGGRCWPGVRGSERIPVGPD